MPPRRRWGWQSRPTTNYSRALTAALRAKELDPDYVRPTLSTAEFDARWAHLESSISPLAGSHDLERAFGGSRRRGEVGIVQLLGGLAHHVPDSRLAEDGQNGWPDSAAVIGKTLYIVEFKRQPDSLSSGQQEWLAGIANIDKVVSGEVKPRDWQAFTQFVVRQAQADRQ